MRIASAAICSWLFGRAPHRFELTDHQLRGENFINSFSIQRYGYEKTNDKTNFRYISYNTLMTAAVVGLIACQSGLVGPSKGAPEGSSAANDNAQLSKKNSSTDPKNQSWQFRCKISALT
jgi:hypothetical protein